MSVTDPNQPDEPHWIPLGVNEVRKFEEETVISIPKKLREFDILSEEERDDQESYLGYWSYERENGWIILGNQKLKNTRNRIQESITEENQYRADETEGDFKYVDNHKLRKSNQLKIPEPFLKPVADIEDTFEDTSIEVPEQARIQPGELRYFMVWSEWLESDPKVAVLFTMDDLPFKDPDTITGLGGNSPGPQFGTDGESLEPPEIGLTN